MAWARMEWRRECYKSLPEPGMVLLQKRICSLEQILFCFGEPSKIWELRYREDIHPPVYAIPCFKQCQIRRQAVNKSRTRGPRGPESLT